MFYLNAKMYKSVWKSSHIDGSWTEAIKRFVFWFISSTNICFFRESRVLTLHLARKIFKSTVRVISLIKILPGILVVCKLLITSGIYSVKRSIVYSSFGDDVMLWQLVTFVRFSKSPDKNIQTNDFRSTLTKTLDSSVNRALHLL